MIGSIIDVYRCPQLVNVARMFWYNLINYYYFCYDDNKNNFIELIQIYTKFHQYAK